MAGGLTEAQAIKFSVLTSTPLGLLFLPSPPPVRTTPIADFRTVQESEPLNRDFYEVFDDIALKQDWYREYLVSNEAEPLPFVGKFASGFVEESVVAASIRQTLKLTLSDLSEVSNAEEHFSLLSSRAEDAGILVFKTGIVGNNTRRKLSERQFRGFAIADAYAPAVFVNGSDSPAAWVFTLAHELAHIWLGESGISDVRRNSAVPIERRCNRIAADVLLPRDHFVRMWHMSEGTDTEKVDALRRRFCVSSLAVAIRAVELDLTTTSLPKQFEAISPKPKKSNGGNFYNTLAIRNSKRLSLTIASLAVSGTITYKEASRLLNVSPNLVAQFHDRFH